MTKDRIIDAFEKKKIKYTEHCSLEKYSSFRIGGNAEIAVFPKNDDELMYIGSVVGEERAPWHIIGNASNILFDDGLLEGVFIFTGGMNKYSFDETRLVCSCGASLTSMAKKSADRGLSGLEFAYGIPGSVGGAVYMNAGAYGACVSDILGSSRFYDMENGTVSELNCEEHNFGYRESAYMERKELVCLSAVFELNKGDKKEVYAKMDTNISSRKEKQPLEYPNAGSYFKRPAGNFAGKLIEDCGLKGFKIGGACVSEKHAGFIVNLGGATAKDVLMLESEVKNRVYDMFGVTLEREVRFVSNKKDQER